MTSFQKFLVSVEIIFLGLILGTTLRFLENSKLEIAESTKKIEDQLVIKSKLFASALNSRIINENRVERINFCDNELFLTLNEKDREFCFQNKNYVFDFDREVKRLLCARRSLDEGGEADKKRRN